MFHIIAKPVIHYDKTIQDFIFFHFTTINRLYQNMDSSEFGLALSLGQVVRHSRKQFWQFLRHT